MGKRIVGYVISHSGKPGGPWEATHGRFGTPTTNPAHRLSTKYKRNLFMLGDIQRIHPAARILRLVRRERHRAEEAAVVEAAKAWGKCIANGSIGNPSGRRAEHRLETATARLVAVEKEAKRGK